MEFNNDDLIEKDLLSVEDDGVEDGRLNNLVNLYKPKYCRLINKSAETEQLIFTQPSVELRAATLLSQNKGIIIVEIGYHWIAS